MPVSDGRQPEKTAREDYEMDDVRKHGDSQGLDSGIGV